LACQARCSATGCRSGWSMPVRPPIELSTTRASAARVKSSTIAGTRSRRPQDSTSATKSSDQRWFGRCGIVIGARVPVARLRPRRRRTASPSSRYSRYSFLWFIVIPSRASRMPSRRSPKRRRSPARSRSLWRISGASAIGARRTVFGSTASSLQARRCEKPCAAIRRRAAAQARSVLGQQVLERRDVEHRLRQQLLQAPVLVLESDRPMPLYCAFQR
jgi:hypothetical protein